MDENMQLCRICISNSECATMIPIFGEDLLWKKITMLADVKVEKGDTLPQQVCMVCAKSVIGACMFKKKCEDADNFFRHHLQMMRKMEQFQRGDGGGADVITISEGSDNDPNDDNVNLVNRHLMTGSNTGLQLMNGNNLSSSVGGSGALLEQQIDNKNSHEMNSVRMMMNNFLLEQQSKEADAMAVVNGYQNEGEFAPPCDASMDDDQLPLIPEIELITPNDDGGTVMDRQHIVNSQQQGYQCSICYQIFVRKFLLKEHMQSCHGRSPPVYECTNCKKSYLYKRFLEKHIRRGRCVKKRRNQTRPMECTDCHVLFPTGHHLGWHKRTGCPSRALKVPLQQLFKQNIVQYNNFPKPVIPPRKPDNALYIENRRILPNTSKRKGRTRIKLDAKKIALAKILILKEATTTQIAQELDISRTFAWRLRKNLVNGVSLHERFVDQQSSEEKQDSIPKAAVIPEETKPPTEEVNFDVKVEQNEEKEHTNAESTVVIKQEVQDDDDDDEEEEDDENDDDDSDNDDDDDESDSDSDSDSESDSDDDEDEDDDDEDEQEEEQNKNSSEQINKQPDELLASQEQNYHCSYTNGANNQMQQQIEQSNYNGVQQTAPNLETPASNEMNMHNENAESDSEDEDGDDNEDDDDDDDDEDEDSEEEGEADEVENSEAQLQKYKQHLMQTLPSVFHIPQPGFPQPVNLSIKSMRPQTTNLTPTTKKPRKPNVFIDDEKYATAKILVSQNSSTMEIARQLNVSQMTAWKLRDAIVKGIPLSYRSKRETRPKADKPEASSTPKEKLPRRRLKAAEREQRDREITREILEMIKEDSNIQYWKVSAKLAEKGFAISPSSVCQKLKSLGIHRRWKPGDKPPILDIDSLKTNRSIVGVGIGGGASGGGGFGGGTSTDSFEFNNEHQFELGGAHFLSAFTH